MAETFPIELGQYQLIERLAVGGMAELFRARVAEGPLGGVSDPAMSPPDSAPDSPLGRDFVGDLSASLAASLSEYLAIKRLLPHLALDPYYRTMFLDEAKLTARLSHPNIIRTYDYGDHDGLPFMVMELVDGLDGLSILRECAHRQVRLPIELAVFATHEVLSALEFAHAQVDGAGNPLGVVHRDISPANVLFGKDGAVKLADFGIAHANQHEQRTRDGTLKGKYSYMSPEQIIGMPVDSRSDVFSAAVLLAEMMMGRRLFAAPSELDVLLMVRDVRLDRLEKYGDHIGADLDRILRKALQREPDERFPTAAVFREALADWLYMHGHEVGTDDIKELIALLYDDAWTRKRERTARQAAQLAQVTGDLTGDLAGELAAELAADPGSVPQPLPRDASGPLPRVSAPFAMPTRSAPQASAQGTLDAVSDLRPSDIRFPDPEQTLERFIDRSAINATSDGIPEVVGKNPSGSSIDRISFGQRIVSGQSPASERDATNKIRRPTIETSPIDSLSELYSGAPGDPADSRKTHDSLLLPEIDFDDDIISEVRDLRTGAVIAPSAAEVEPTGEERAGAIGAIEGRPDESGDFASTSAIELLYRLAAERATGVLVARRSPDFAPDLAVDVAPDLAADPQAGERASICKEISLRRGVPEYVASSLESDLFGAYLIRAGVIAAGELSMALAVQAQYGGRLGETLVKLGLLQPLDVFRYLSQQLREKVVDVCTWTDGTYELYLGRENVRPKFPLALNPFEIIGASVRLIDAGMLFDWADSLAMRRPAGTGDLSISPELFGLGRGVRRVLSELDGSLTVAELRANHALSNREEAWVRIFYLLVYTRLVALG